MKISKDKVIGNNMLIYRNVFVYNDSQWCGGSGSRKYNPKRHVVDDWKHMYCATGVPSECPEWNWGRGDS
jgi:hypothetical protein